MNAGSVIRVVLDTNIFISALLAPHGWPAQVLAAWRRNAFDLVLSRELWTELAEVLRRDDIRRRIRRREWAADLLYELEASGDMVRPLPLDELPVGCRDPKDDHLLACALGGRANFLVTGDEDLLVLNGDDRLGGLSIVRVVDFLDRLPPTT
jgi:putative PIN family toxin of toxin-antitoxin system